MVVRLASLVKRANCEFSFANELVCGTNGSAVCYGVARASCLPYIPAVTHFPRTILQTRK